MDLSAQLQTAAQMKAIGMTAADFENSGFRYKRQV